MSTVSGHRLRRRHLRNDSKLLQRRQHALIHRMTDLDSTQLHADVGVGHGDQRIGLLPAAATAV